MARIRARQDGEVIQLDRESLLALVQTDAELSEILTRAFILRRVELLAQGIGDATLLARVSGLSSVGTQQERKTSSLARL
jgi:thioredoxin reductase (NADPH)